MTITTASGSPLASGSIYGLRVGVASDWGQGSEIGKGRWVPIDSLSFTDLSGNVVLRSAQTTLKLTGYYRPERR